MVGYRHAFLILEPKLVRTDALKHSSLEKYVLGTIPGRVVNISNNIGEIPLTCPELRKGSGREIRTRHLRWLNRFFRTGVLEVIGSPWLPGFFVLNAEESRSVINVLKEKEALSCRATLAITTEPVAGPGWVSFAGDPMMVLHRQEHWHEFEDYLADMKQKYRQRAKKALQQKGSFEVVELTPNTDHWEEAARLLEQTLSDKVIALPANLREMLDLFSVCFQEYYTVYGFVQNGLLIGMISTIMDGQELRAMHFGARKDAPRDFYSLAMFEVIKRGIQAKVSRINLGRTATEIKSTYGAVAEANYFSFYTAHKTFELMFRAVLRRYKPKEYELRSPFKELVPSKEKQSVV